MGRWPSDAPEAWRKRAQYFVVGAFKTYREEEVQEISKNRLAAADASGTIATEEPPPPVDEQGMLYFVRPLETKQTAETADALQDIINEINCMYKTKVIWRLHADRASELSGERIRDHFRPQGIRVTSTAGYEPNANGRAEGAINILKARARAMLHGLGPQGRELWPLAVQHAAWCSRSGSDESRLVVPAFGETVTVKIKKVPSDSFAPRGKEMVFLGGMDHEVTNGVIVGNYTDGEWHFDASSSFTIHPPLPKDPKDKSDAKSEHFVTKDSTHKNEEEFDNPANSPIDDDDVFKIIPEKVVTCPACLGRHRAHTHDINCKLGPDPPEVEADLYDPFEEPEDLEAPQGVGGEPAGTAIPGWHSCPACR